MSHDRWFVSELATRIIELTPTGPNDFPGTYAEYLARCGDDHLDADAVVLKAKSARAETATAAPGGDSKSAASAVSWEEQKRRRNRLAQLPKLRDKVMAAIEAAEARKKAIHERYADPSFYAQTSHDEIDALGEELAALGPKLDALMTEWEGLEREIARPNRRRIRSKVPVEQWRYRRPSITSRSSCRTSTAASTSRSICAWRATPPSRRPTC